LLGATPTEIQRLAGELPPWCALVGIAGRSLLPEERVAAQTADLAEIARQSGLAMEPALGAVTGDRVRDAAIRPSGTTHWKDTCKGSYQDLFFTTTLDRTPAFVDRLDELAATAGYPASEIGVYLQPQNMGTSYHCEFTLPYAPESGLETERLRMLFSEASCAVSGLGAYFLRPYGEWSRLQLDRDTQSASTLKRLKGIFDPNGILNPGQLSGT
jgi:FAD/FMN-containing dehydrogenase